MTLGEKIKSERKRRGMTQSELCDGRITRNMISCIENGSALPSLETLIFIADRLGLPAGCLLSDEYDLAFYTRHKTLVRARKLYAAGKYKECIALLDDANIEDDETNYLNAYSHFKLALELFGGGSLLGARHSFELALEYSSKTVYDTSYVEGATPLYLAVCENASLPLLDFNEAAFIAASVGDAHYQFYKYLIGDTEFNFVNEQYASHMKAKRLIKERQITEAIDILSRLEDRKKEYPPNAYLMFCVYTDLESCYKSLLDFEKAYKYASKRISLIEGFSS